MSHNIHSRNGKALYAGFRVPAWHLLREPFQNEITDAFSFLSEIGLSREVIDVPTFAEYNGNRVEVPGGKTILSVWDNGDVDVYPRVMGRQYTIVQDIEAFGVFDGMADVTGNPFRWETGAALKGGSKVFGSVALERDIVLDPNGVADVVKMYGLVVNDHNGGGSHWGTTAQRAVCANTLPGPSQLSNLVRFRKTESVHERMAVQAAIWRDSMGYIDATEALYSAMLATPVTDKQFDNLLKTVQGTPKEGSKAAQTRYDDKREAYLAAYRGERGEGIKGTAWGAWQALTDVAQWGRQLREDEGGTERFAMAGMGLDTAANTFRESTRDLIVSRFDVKVPA